MMDFVTHLPRTSQGHDVVWVIMDRLKKLEHFLVLRMTNVHSIGSRSRVCGSFLEEFPASHGDTVDDKHNFSSPNE